MYWFEISDLVEHFSFYKGNSDTVSLHIHAHFPFLRVCEYFHDLSIQRGRETFWAPPASATVAKSLQSYWTLCDPRDSNPPGSAVPGILQARTLQWVAISFNAWTWKVKGKSLSRVRLLATPWTAAHQTSPSMGFSRQEYWSGVPLPSPRPSLTPKTSSCCLDFNLKAPGPSVLGKICIISSHKILTQLHLKQQSNLTNHIIEITTFGSRASTKSLACILACILSISPCNFLSLS